MKKKKFLSILLALVMVISMMPTAVFATETPKNYIDNAQDEKASAFKSYVEGNSLTFTDDYFFMAEFQPDEYMQEPERTLWTKDMGIKISTSSEATLEACVGLYKDTGESTGTTFYPTSGKMHRIPGYDIQLWDEWVDLMQQLASDYENQELMASYLAKQGELEKGTYRTSVSSSSPASLATEKQYRNLFAKVTNNTAYETVYVGFALQNPSALKEDTTVTIELYCVSGNLVAGKKYQGTEYTWEQTPIRTVTYTFTAPTASKVAKIGDTKYETLAEAIAAVPNNGETPTTIIMLCDVTNAVGISVPSGKNFIVDFDGHTYTVNKPGAGSTGTTTQAFQLNKNSTVVFKNGTINVAEDNLTAATAPAKNIKRLIQNYANLTLENMTLDGTNLYVNDSNTNRAVVETANGNVNITGSTSIKGKEDGDVGALNVDTWKGAYNGGSKVAIKTTGTVDAIYLYSEGTATAYTKSSLAITGGKFVSVTGDSSNDYTSAISGGYFKFEIDSKYIAPGYECVTNPDYNVSEKDTKDYQYMVRSKIVIPVDDDPSAGNIEVQIDTESEQKEATVDTEKVKSTEEKAVATEIIGKINGSGSGENKSEVVDLTETVGNFLSKIDLDEVKEIAKETDTKHKTTKLSDLNTFLDNAKEAAKNQNVEVTMNVTTDVDVKVVGVTVEKNDKEKVTRFALDITPYYTLTVTSKVDGVEQTPVQIVTEDMKEQLDVPETTTVTFPAPDGFVYTSGMSLFVIHTKESGEKFTYPATYNSGTKMISFTNPDGFSEFEVVTSSVVDPIAQNVQTEKFYTDLEEALSEAESSGNDQTVIILKDLTTANSLKQGTLEVAPNVTLDLNGYDLEAKTVLAWGLVMNNRGSADGKLITAEDHFAYFGGKEMAASDENVMPVWDTTGETNGYVFYAVNVINHKSETNNNGDPKYKFQPKSNDIQTILGENSGVKVYVDFSYDQTDSEGTHHKHLTVEFGRSYLTQFLTSPETLGMYVTLLGTEGVSNITAKSYLKAENCNFSIESAEINLSGKTTINE